MVKKHQYKDLVWYDLEKPTHDEVRELMEAFNIDPLAAEELLTKTVKPKVDMTEDHIYMVLHFPMIHQNMHRGLQSEISQEIDFIIGEKFLITAHYDHIDALDNFSHIFETEGRLAKHRFGNHAGYIFFYILRDLYRSMVHELESIRESLRSIENKIFHDEEKKMVYSLSRINRDLLTFKEATNLHKSVLESFEIASKKLFGDDFAPQMQSIMNEYYRNHAAIQESKEFLDELRKTNDSLLAARQNETIKISNILATIFLPPSFILWLFSIRSPIPFLEHEYSFWIVAACLFVLGCCIFVFYKFKRWL